MRIRALNGADAAAIAGWRYAGEYSTYDVADPSDLATDHWAVTEGGELVGYCCFGAPARVAGAEPAVGTLDIGYGIPPASAREPDAPRYTERSNAIPDAENRRAEPQLDKQATTATLRERQVCRGRDSLLCGFGGLLFGIDGSQTSRAVR